MSLNQDKERPGLLKGSLSFINLILIILLIRWIVFEIFVIPSGSMYPKLYVNDYIIVSKVDFGLRIPFTQKWAAGPYLPERESIVVFKDPDDTKYLIKRLVGLPGDKIEVYGDFIISVNSKKVEHIKFTEEEKAQLALEMEEDVENFEAFREIFPDGQGEHTILTYGGEEAPANLSVEEISAGVETYEPPEGYLFFMGDNRNNSLDGRRFGHVEADRLVGRSRFVVLSCSKKLAFGMGCGLTSLRLNRLGNGIAY